MPLANNPQSERHSIQKQSGYVLILVPIILVAILLIASRMLSRSQVTMAIAAAEMNVLQTRLCVQQCASLGVNSAAHTIENNSLPTASHEACTCEPINHTAMACTTDISTPTQSSQSNCFGQILKSTDISLLATCEEGPARHSALNEKASFEELPVFQFAVFFDKLLEIHPGPQMNLNGKIHCNDTILLYPGNELYLYDWITTPGPILLKKGFGKSKIYFPLMDGSGPDLSAPIKPSNVAPEELKKLVSSWSGWKKDHRAAYGDNENGCGKVQKLSLPLKKSVDPNVVLDWRDIGDDANTQMAKFAWKATLIYNGVWLDKSLAPAPFSLGTDPLIKPTSPLFDSLGNRITFYDKRDKVTLKLLPINFDLLVRNRTDSIIYLYDELKDPSQSNQIVGGFLIYNAKKLLRPLTLVTNSRMVLLGSYNTDSGYAVNGLKSAWPSSLVSDNMTQLSYDFLPNEHSLGMGPGSSIIGRNNKARVTVNACIMTGMIAQNGSHAGQGGYQNLVRFLENWDNVPYEKTGSSVCIWDSRHSWGNNNINGVYFTPPIRVYNFDPMYNAMINMPPGTPRMVLPVLTDWELVRR